MVVSDKVSNKFIGLLKKIKAGKRQTSEIKAFGKKVQRSSKNYLISC